MTGWPPFRTAPLTPRIYHLAMAVLFALLAPAVLGTLLILAHSLIDGGLTCLSPASHEHPASLVFFLGIVGVVSPLLSWLGFLTGVPLAALAIRKGCAGWLIFVLIGLVAAVVALLIIGPQPPIWQLALVLGPCQALAYGWLLRRLIPQKPRSIDKPPSGKTT